MKSFLLLMLLVGCIGNQPSKVETPDKSVLEEVIDTHKTIQPTEVLPDTIADRKTPYAIVVNNQSIPIHGWDYNYNFSKLFGTPLEEKVVQLGDGADTHKGSYVKNIKYSGLALELFSPNQNGNAYWIKTIQWTNPKYVTPGGIKVGNSVTELKEKYPKIPQVLDGRTDPQNCAYEIKNDDKFLRFEVKKGMVKEIRVYVEIP
ncbi:MAG: hypothetical protein M3Q56_09875 [Bacteroidota bacterium]|nr:hypothetical protein [Bacteroidota bacterium]